MSQQEIIKFLKKKKKPVDMQELLVAIPSNRASITRGCRKLIKSNEIKVKEKQVKNYKKFYYFL